jgi:hypothetical protein
MSKCDPVVPPGITKKYKGVRPRMNTLKAEMKVLRKEWRKKLRAKAIART